MSIRPEASPFQWAGPGEPRWVLRVVGLLFAGGLFWGLLRYGATEEQNYYRLFLIMTIPTLIAWWFLPLQVLRGRRMVPFLLSGAALLVATFALPTLQARGYVVTSLGWMALFLALLLTAESRQRTRWVALFLIGIGIFEAVFGLVQSLAGIDYIGSYFRNLGNIATGTLIHQNHFAGLLNMTLPFALGALLAVFATRNSRGEKRSEVYAWSWLVLLSCSLIGLAVILSRSRAGAAILMLAMILMTLLLWLKSRGRTARVLPSAVPWILLMLIVGLGLWVGVDSFYEKVQQTSPDLDWRLTVYKDSLQLLGEQGIFGVGPRQFEWHFRPFQTGSARFLVDFAHNDYLQSAIEWGIPLALIFWLFVGWRMVRAARVFLISTDPWRQGIAMGCAVSIMTILAHSLVDFNLQIPGNLMVFCIVLGLAWSIDLHAPREAARERIEEGL